MCVCCLFITLTKALSDPWLSFLPGLPPLTLWRSNCTKQLGNRIQSSWGGQTQMLHLENTVDTHWENHTINRYLGRDMLSLCKYLASESACSFCLLQLTSQEVTWCFCAFLSMSIHGNSFVRKSSSFSSTFYVSNFFTYVSVDSGTVILYIGF